uniref:EGF-like domain-containing protein n=1 Tax=Anabas testudineus TaxID=64144 RepID=A0A7N6BGX8_ANATE
MASPGLLFLLLMLSSPLLSSMTSPSSSNKQEVHHLQKRGSTAKKLLSAGDYIVKFASATSPFIGMIPIVGQYINNFTGLAKFIISVLKGQPDLTKALLEEFKNLNLKIDEYHVEQKWDQWASQYYNIEVDIELAWNEFEKVVQVFNDTDNLEDRKNILLSEHFKCHEKDIKEFVIFLNTLIYKGNSVKLFYDRLAGVSSEEELAKIAFECAKVMFEIHNNCISNSLKYVKEDIEKQIPDIEDRDELAKFSRLFLERTYDRYNWITVAFRTKGSTHRHAKQFNKHILSGFINMTKGDVTVAVARQIKGNQTKADKVRKAIENCLDKSVDCQNIANKLSECKESVDGIKIDKTYTAVHAYISESHDSFNALDAKQAPDEEYLSLDTPSRTPYIYTGVCRKFKAINTGHFRVLIKSDEEMMGENPCDKLNCGDEGKGNCQDYYGEHCEESLEDYKHKLIEGIPQKQLDVKNSLCRTCCLIG